MAVCTGDEAIEGLVPVFTIIADCIPTRCLAVALTFLIMVSMAVSCPIVSSTVGDMVNFSDRSLVVRSEIVLP